MNATTSLPLLIVEDNPDNAQLTRWILEDEGYKLALAETAEQALDMLAQTAYAVVLMDISLPGMDGKEAIAKIRATESIKLIPVIAVTAHAVLDERDAILASGADFLVTKPIMEEALITAINRCLSGDFPERTNT